MRIFAILVALTATSRASDCINYADYLHLESVLDTPGSTLDIASDESHLYFLDSQAGLLVADSRASGPPLVVASMPQLAGATKLQHKNSLLFVLGPGTFLNIVDVSAASEPKLLVSQVLPRIGVDLDVEGDFVYIVDIVQVLIYDISRLPSVGLMASMQTPGEVRSIDVKGNLACIVDGPGGIRVIDVSFPYNPSIVGTVRGLSAARALTFDGTVAYVAYSSAIVVLDFSNPLKPRELGRIGIGRTADEIVLTTDTIFAVANGGMAVVERAAPFSAKSVSSVQFEGSGLALTLQASRAFVAGGQAGVFSLDISNARAVKALWSHVRFASVSGIALRGTYAYVLCSEAIQGPVLRVIMNVADYLPPIQAEVILPYDGRSIVIAGNHAFITSAYGLLVYDVSELYPVYVTELPWSFGAHEIQLQGGYAYVAAGAQGLAIIDVNVPTSPRLVSLTDTPGNAVSLALQDDIAYLASETSGLQILDVQDATAPIILGSVDTPGTARVVDVVAGLAYVSDWPGVQVIDVSEPAAPALLTRFVAAKYCVARVSGGIAYVCDYNGIFVLDVSDPLAPTELGRTSDTTGSLIFFTQSFVYVAGNGYSVLPYQCSAGQPPLEVPLQVRPIDLNSSIQTKMVQAIVVLPSEWTSYDFTGNTIEINGISIDAGEILITPLDESNDVQRVQFEVPLHLIRSSLQIGMDVPFEISGDFESGYGFVAHAGIQVFDSSQFGLVTMANPTIVAGSQELLSWQPMPDEPNPVLVRGFISLDAGLSWQSNFEGTASNGEYLWLVPELPAPAAQLILERVGSAGVHLARSELIAIVDPSITPVEPTSPVQSELWIQAVPNPTRGLSTIVYHLPGRVHAQLDIFDLAGRRIETLVDEMQSLGEHSIQWRATASESWNVLLPVAGYPSGSLILR